MGHKQGLRVSTSPWGKAAAGQRGVVHREVGRPRSGRGRRAFSAPLPPKSLSPGRGREAGETRGPCREGSRVQPPPTLECRGRFQTFPYLFGQALNLWCFYKPQDHVSEEFRWPMGPTWQRAPRATSTSSSSHAAFSIPRARPRSGRDPGSMPGDEPSFGWASRWSRCIHKLQATSHEPRAFSASPTGGGGRRPEGGG